MGRRGGNDPRVKIVRQHRRLGAVRTARRMTVGVQPLIRIGLMIAALEAELLQPARIVGAHIQRAVGTIGPPAEDLPRAERARKVRKDGIKRREAVGDRAERLLRDEGAVRALPVREGVPPPLRLVEGDLEDRAGTDLCPIAERGALPRLAEDAAVGTHGVHRPSAAVGAPDPGGKSRHTGGEDAEKQKNA